VVFGTVIAVVFEVIALALIGLHQGTFARAMLALVPWLPVLALAGTRLSVAHRRRTEGRTGGCFQ
jgi:hypothetical protein